MQNPDAETAGIDTAEHFGANPFQVRAISVLYTRFPFFLLRFPQRRPHRMLPVPAIAVCRPDAWIECILPVPPPRDA
jgi:hypothetical protein